MKSLILRSSVALACALSLAACGGGGGNLVLGGVIYGLTKSGLELQNNNGPALAIQANQTGFAFPELLRNDEDYNVTVKTQPTGAHCEPSFNKGRTGAFNVQSVVVTCVTDSHALSGQVNNLKADGLVLINGSDRVTVPAGATSVVFAKVFDGAPYGITILSQPNGQTCTVANGTGTMSTADVGNVLVNCN